MGFKRDYCGVVNSVIHIPITQMSHKKLSHIVFILKDRWYGVSESDWWAKEKQNISGNPSRWLWSS